MTVAITTAPRPEPTFTRSVASLREAGYTGDVLVFDDTEPVGIVENWCRAVEALLIYETPYLLLMQDDVTWTPDSWAGAIQILNVLPYHAIGYASLHTMPRIRVALGEPEVLQWHRTDTIRERLYKQRWCGAQCWVMSRGPMVSLLADPDFHRYRLTNRRGFDHQVTETLVRLGYHTYTWCPSYVSHGLGEGNRAKRQK